MFSGNFSGADIFNKTIMVSLHFLSMSLTCEQI